MKVNAIVVVKNEADIIEESLLNAMKFCNRIYIYDNGSTDGTWETLNEMAYRFNELSLVGQAQDECAVILKISIYNMFHVTFTDNDWWYLLNANELLSGSPICCLQKASQSGCDVVNVWQAQFFFTDEDFFEFDKEDSMQSISKRRKYYSINNMKKQFFKNNPAKKIVESSESAIPKWAANSAKTKLFSRVYSSRTPLQIEKQRVLFEHNSQLPYKSIYPIARHLDKYENDGCFHIRLSCRLKLVKKYCRTFFSRTRNILTSVFSYRHKHHVTKTKFL